MKIRLYIEGGPPKGRGKKLGPRAAFTQLLERAGFKGRMPKVRCFGGRKETFEAFCTALRDDEELPVLLVDSESQVSASAWAHLQNQDGWQKPDEAEEDQAQLMVTCMETWIVADHAALKREYGKALQESALPPQTDLEKRSPQEIQQALEKATRDAGEKRMYRKGSRSFQLVAALDPPTLKTNLPHFRRLIETLEEFLVQ